MTTVLTLLRLHWQQRWRRGRSQTLLRRIAYVLFGELVGVFFVGWIGLVFPDILAESGISRAPHHILNEHLLSVFAGLLLVRFLLQRSVGQGWRPFLTLPVRRMTLARAMQGSAAVSLMNLLPLVAVAVLAKSTIALGAPARDVPLVKSPGGPWQRSPPGSREHSDVPLLASPAGGSVSAAAPRDASGLPRGMAFAPRMALVEDLMPDPIARFRYKKCTSSAVGVQRHYW